jgi:hypothetical protein
MKTQLKFRKIPQKALKLKGKFKAFKLSKKLLKLEFSGKTVKNNFNL